MDSRVDRYMSDRHSIIYGHHMKDGTMFSGLTKYKKQNYYEAHPEGLLITPEVTYRIKIFAGYVTSVEDSAWEIEFESDEEYQAGELLERLGNKKSAVIIAALNEYMITHPELQSPYCKIEVKVGSNFSQDNVEQIVRTIIEETVVLLSHKKPDGHINVKVEFGEGEGKVPLDNIAKRAEEYKPKERVTYKMIKEYIEAKYGFKVHTAYIAEVKRDLGLPMYDAPNAVEELKQPRKHPTAEKVEAIKDALKHFEVI